jgi:hypothetical protein
VYQQNMPEQAIQSKGLGDRALRMYRAEESEAAGREETPTLLLLWRRRDRRDEQPQ